jgi:hypothetical protein
MPEIPRVNIQSRPKVTYLVARQVRATFASDSRMWRASGVNLAHSVAQTLRARCAYDASRVAHVSCKWFAHMPREERATRDVTFGP